MHGPPSSNPPLSARTAPVQLAHEPTFSLGALIVSPATRQAKRGARSETIEPRVMQVLVALAQVGGDVVSRDELITRCWDGRIVGDNAIDRVLSQLRRLSAGIGADCFVIETIPRVGYRLQPGDTKTPDGAPAPLPTRQTAPRQTGAILSRRQSLVAGGVATMSVAGGLAYWGWIRATAPPASAVALYEAALMNLREGGANSDVEAIAFLNDAVRIAPRYAAAWGALATTYASQDMDQYPQPEISRLRARDAATRALAIDPDEPRALLARIWMEPRYRRWLDYERRSRAVLVHEPHHIYLLTNLAMTLCEVGRWMEAARIFKALNNDLQINAVGHYFTLRVLWASGQMASLDEAIEDDLRRFPTSEQIWQTVLRIKMFSGRPAEALAMIAEKYPSDSADNSITSSRVTAEALKSGFAADAGRARQFLWDMLHKQTDPGLVPVLSLVALGFIDDAFALCRGYYFGQGPFASTAPAEGDRTRGTSILFLPPMARLWRDARFAALLRAIELEDYWRRSGIEPDFRKR